MAASRRTHRQTLAAGGYSGACRAAAKSSPTTQLPRVVAPQLRACASPRPCAVVALAGLGFGIFGPCTTPPRPPARAPAGAGTGAGQILEASSRMRFRRSQKETALSRSALSCANSASRSARAGLAS